MRIGVEVTANISYILIAIYALTGRVQAIQALAMSWLFTMISPGIAPDAELGSVGRYAVLAGAATSVFFRSGFLNRSMRVTTPVLMTILLGMFLLVHSWLFSPMPDVSILKAISWMVAVSTLFSAWAGLSPSARENLINQIFYGLIALLIISLPLLSSPLGYLRNGTGFQGVLKHPQVFGPTMAILGTWAVSRMLSDPAPPWRSLVLCGASFAIVVMSEARTAGLAMVLAILTTFITASALVGRPIKSFFPGLASRRGFAVISISILISLLASPFYMPKVMDYLTKRTDSENIAEAYEASRGALMLKMWINIEQRPIFGSGFGIASDPGSMLVERDSILGLPTSANIEKGVMPLAVLEEVGIVGAAFVALWLWMLIKRSIRREGAIALAIVLTVLFLNLGESVLFSPGGLGMILLIVLGWAVTGSRSKRGMSHA